MAQTIPISVILCTVAMLISLPVFVNSLPKNIMHEKWVQHVHRVKNFSCQEPQKRLVTINELLKEEYDSTLHYFPKVSVLSRCDASTGCCTQQGYTCSPLDTDEVKLVFKIVDVINNPNDHKWKVVHATNHTKCACMTLSPPK